MGVLFLYVLTAALELPVILARYLATYVVAAVLLKATGHPSASADGWAKLALIPTLWSAAALVNPAGSGWWWQQRLGGREPSKREHLLYQEALARLEAATTMLLPTPKRWFVLDAAEPDAAVCGDTLMLSSGLLRSPDLIPVLAHELGHLGSVDARLTAAVNRLRIEPLRPERRPEQRPGTNPAGGVDGPAAGGAPAPPPARPEPHRRGLTRWAVRMTLALLRGGLALHLTAPAWGQVWREAELQADGFAARIGQGGELADFLERHVLRNDHPIPLVWLSERTHPPTELRIERLREAAAKQQPTSTSASTPTSAPAVLDIEAV